MRGKNYVLLFVLITLSLNCKSQWKRVVGIPDSAIIRVPVQVGNKLFGGYYGCYFTSDDYGISWQRNVNDSIPSTFTIINLYNFQNYLFAFGASGIFRSPDSGRTWKRMSNIVTYNMFSLNEKLFVKGDNGNGYSLDSGKTYIFPGGNCGTYHYNPDNQALVYPYVKVKDSILFLECGVLGIFKSIDTGQTYTGFGFNIDGPQNAITYINNKLFIAHWQLADTANIFTSGVSSPNWIKIFNNLNKQILYLGNNGKTLFGTTSHYPYYSNDFDKSVFTWKMMDTTGLSLDTFVNNPNYYYVIPYVVNYDANLFLAVYTYKYGTTGPVVPYKNLYYTAPISKIVIPDNIHNINNFIDDNSPFNVYNKIGTSDFEITIKDVHNSNVSLTVYNVYGIRIKQKEYNNAVREISDNISLSEVPSGIYLFVLEKSGRRFTKKTILVN